MSLPLSVGNESIRGHAGNSQAMVPIASYGDDNIRQGRSSIQRPLVFKNTSLWAKALVCFLGGAELLLVTSKAAGLPRIEPLEIHQYDPDRPGQSASDLVSLAPDRFIIADHVLHRFYVIDASGRELSNFAMPPGFRVKRVATFPDRVELLDLERSKKIVWSRSNSSGATPPSSAPEQDLSGKDPARLAAAFVRNTAARVTSIVPDASGKESKLSARSVGVGYMMSITYIGQDAAGIRYSLAREVDVKDGQLFVRLSAASHDSTGKRMNMVEIALACMAKVPAGSYVTPTPDGRIAYLLTTKRGGKRQLNLVVSDLRPAPATRRDAVIDCRDEYLRPHPIERKEVTDDFTADGDIADHDSADTPAAQLRLPSKSEMRRTISSYLNIRIPVTNANYGPPNDVCPADGKTPGFTRPRTIHASMIGRDATIPMPYGWGNKDTPKQFLDRIIAAENASWIGNICTNRGGGLGRRTAGVDCSGLVSNVWGIAPRSTSELQEAAVSRPVADISRMRFGDIYNAPGDHVRLHLRLVTDAHEGDIIRTVESTTACEGVCIHNLHIDHFNGFWLRRQSGR